MNDVSSVHCAFGTTGFSALRQRNVRERELKREMERKVDGERERGTERER